MVRSAFHNTTVDELVASAGWDNQPASFSGASASSFSAPAFGTRTLHNGKPQQDCLAVHTDMLSFAAGGACIASEVADAPAALADCDADDSLSWFGVFDGHGGKEVAEFARENLHRHFLAALCEGGACAGPGSACDALECSSSLSSSLPLDRGSFGYPTSTDTDEGVFLSSGSGTGSGGGGGGGGYPPPSAATPPPTPPAGRSPFSASGTAAPDLERSTGTCPPSPMGSAAAAAAFAASAERRCEAIGRALQRAFSRADRDLSGTEVGELVGSTALVAVVGRGEVHVAHCGDSRAVLVRKGAAISLTADHKPDRHDESARVKASGGRVVYRAGAHRVMGMLAMSRALGDHFLRPYVIAEPEVTSFQRSADDELLLLATDGLWDVFTPQEAALLALRTAARARARGAARASACRVASDVLSRAAIQRGSRDNITVVTVDLRGAPSRRRRRGGSFGSFGAAAAAAAACGGGGAAGEGDEEEEELAPSFSSVLASQLSGEFSFSFEGDGASSGGDPDGDGEVEGAAPGAGAEAEGGGGDGGGGGGGGSPVKGGGWLSGLLSRGARPPGPVGGGGAATAAAGGGSGGAAFQPPTAGTPRRAPLSLRRACTITPVSVGAFPQSPGAGPAPANGAAAAAAATGAAGEGPRRSLDVSGCRPARPGAAGGGGGGGGAPQARAKAQPARCRSLSAFELGHCLRHTTVDCSLTKHDGGAGGDGGA